MDNTQYRTIFGDGLWKNVSGSLVVERGTKLGTLYMTDSNREIAVVADLEGKSKLCKLEGVSENGMKVC